MNFKCVQKRDLHLLRLKMARTHEDKILCDFPSIKLHSYTFRRCMDVNSTSEVNRNTKENTLKRIAEQGYFGA